jgi:hypothetical protein
MLHARTKPPPSVAPPPKEKKKEKPKLEEFIEARDYLGAVTLLEVRRGTISSITSPISFSSLLLFSFPSFSFSSLLLLRLFYN